MTKAIACHRGGSAGASPYRARDLRGGLAHEFFGERVGGLLEELNTVLAS